VGLDIPDPLKIVSAIIAKRTAGRRPVPGSLSSTNGGLRVVVGSTGGVDVRLSLGEAEGHGAGNSAVTATEMRVVNAVPHVVDAAPGLLSSLDLPLTLPRHAF
jgi:hypothetical protein